MTGHGEAVWVGRTDPCFWGGVEVPIVAFVCQRQGYGVESVTGTQPIVVMLCVWGREVVGKRWSPLV